MADFYLTLPSNTRDGGGNIANFYVNLPETIDLEGQWSVALTEIMYPYTTHNIYNAAIKVNVNEGFELIDYMSPEGVRLTEEIGAAGEIDRDVVPVDNFYVIRKKNLSYAGTIPNSHYTTLKEVEIVINASYHRIWMDRKKRLKTSENLFQQVPFLKEAYDYFEHMKHQFKVVFNHLINRYAFAVGSPIEHVQLSEQLCYLLGYKESSFSIGNYVSSHPPDICGGINCIYVYLPIIEPQIVGDSRVCLLKVVPIKGKYGEQTLAEFSNLEYIPVSVRRFSSVQVSINTADGRPVPFAFGSVILKLHFRRRSL